MFYCSIKARISLKDLSTEYLVPGKAALNFWGGFFLVSRIVSAIIFRRIQSAAPIHFSTFFLTFSHSRTLAFTHYSIPAFMHSRIPALKRPPHPSEYCLTIVAVFCSLVAVKKLSVYHQFPVIAERVGQGRAKKK
jgi:hypothetical protein